MSRITLARRTGLVGLARASHGGAVIAIGLVLSLDGRAGDFGVVARSIAAAHVLAQFTDTGGLAALVARSGDPEVAASRGVIGSDLVRRIGGRTVALIPVAAVAGSLFEVPPLASTMVFVGVTTQRAVGEWLRSQGRIERYAVVAGIGPSGLWLVAVGGLVVGGHTVGAPLVSVLYGVALVAVAGGSAGLDLADRRPGGSAGDSTDGGMVTGGLARLPGQGPLFLEGLLEATVRNVDVLLIALVVGPGDAGLYALASRAVAVAMTPLAAVNGALAHEYSQRWATGGREAVSRLARPVTRRITVVPAVMLVGAAVGAGFSGPGDPGGALPRAAAVAAVLLAGAMVSTASGSAGLLLGICHRARESAIISLVSIGAGVVMLLGFGVVGGLLPAAAGFAAGVGLQNLWQTIQLRRSVGVVAHL